MGNQASSTKNAKDTFTLERVLGQIAAKYITSQNFRDLQRLGKKEYCDKLVILTSNILANHFTQMEIEYLAKKKEAGKDVNKMAKEKVTAFLNSDKIRTYDVKNTIKKQRMCISLSKFYITVANIYAAILKTVNPEYNYTNPYGDDEKIDYLERSEIPADAREDNRVKLVKTNNLVARRIQSLVSNVVMDSNNKPTDQITFTANICSMNAPMSGSDSFHLSDEPGIPELKSLYYDIFDFEKGVFNKMSPEATEDYMKHLREFHAVFTGESSMPSTVLNFSDIKLFDYGKSELCSEESQDILEQTTFSMKDTLFRKYAEQNKRMMAMTKSYQNKLLEILNMIFVYLPNVDNPKNKDITINPSLKYADLLKIAKQTRVLIVEYYITAEKEMVQMLSIFEMIVKKITLDANKRKLQEIEKEKEAILSKANASAKSEATEPAPEEKKQPVSETYQGDRPEQKEEEEDEEKKPELAPIVQKAPEEKPVTTSELERDLQMKPIEPESETPKIIAEKKAEPPVVAQPPQAPTEEVDVKAAPEDTMAPPPAPKPE